MTASLSTIDAAGSVADIRAPAPSPVELAACPGKGSLTRDRDGDGLADAHDAAPEGRRRVRPGRGRRWLVRHLQRAAAAGHPDPGHRRGPAHHAGPGGPQHPPLRTGAGPGPRRHRQLDAGGQLRPREELHGRARQVRLRGRAGRQRPHPAQPHRRPAGGGRRRHVRHPREDGRGPQPDPGERHGHRPGRRGRAGRRQLRLRRGLPAPA